MIILFAALILMPVTLHANEFDTLVQNLAILGLSQKTWEMPPAEVPFAAEMKERSAFCHDPYKYVCSKKVKSVNLEQLIQPELDLKAKELALAEIREIFPKYEIDGEPVLYEEELKKSYDETGTTHYVIYYFSNYYRLSDQKAFEKNPLDLKTYVNALNYVLEAFLRERSGLSDNVKKTMIARMNTTVLATIRDLSALGATRQVLVPKVHNTCGAHAERANALYSQSTWDDHGAPKDMILVCPTTLLAAKDPSFRVSLFRTIAHEMGHSISHSVSAGDLKKLTDCFHEQWNSNEIFDSESLADHFASEVMAKILVHQPKVQALKYIKQAYGKLCNFQGDEKHPSGRFRIEQLFGRNANVREAMGCKPSESKKLGCGI